MLLLSLALSVVLLVTVSVFESFCDGTSQSNYYHRRNTVKLHTSHTLLSFCYVFCGQFYSKYSHEHHENVPDNGPPQCRFWVFHLILARKSLVPQSGREPNGRKHVDEGSRTDFCEGKSPTVIHSSVRNCVRQYMSVEY